MVRIMIADDHILIRQVVRDVVENEHDLEIVAEAADGQEAERRAAETQPDVVLMDLAMPVCDGFEATEKVLACSPRSRVVIFSASDEEHQVLHALQRGAVGYVTKNVGPEGLITAIRRAALGEFYMPHPLSTHVLAYLRTLNFAPARKKQPGSSAQIAPKSITKPPRKKHSKRGLQLSGREQQILILIRQGKRNREIAVELRIAESTVHKHVQNILEKLNARNRAEAIFLAQA